jgi:putative peptidoglycan lipid II flippase
MTYNRGLLPEQALASLTASAARVGAFTLLSRILGFVRDLVIARLFGADGGTDAFFVAFKVPNLMRRLFTEGAFAMAFVPLMNAQHERHGGAALRRFAGDLAGTFGALLLLITVLGVVAAPLLVVLFAPGFAADSGQSALTADLLRLTFPYLLFIGLTALAGGILNTVERFGVPAFTPVLLNLTLILCAVFLAPSFERPVLALAWGVFLAGLVQLAFQLPFLARLGLLPRPRFRPRDPQVRRVLLLMAPTLLGVSVTQLNLFVDTLLASFLDTGSISWLYYSDRLMEFPLGLLGVALGTVILPRLSRGQALRDPPAFSATVDWALRWAVLLGLPAAVGLLALAGPIIAALFHSGAFTLHDVLMAERSLMAYALGLLAFIAIKVLTPAFYSRQQLRTPVRVAVVALVVNIVLSLLLMAPLGHAGLALGTVLAALVNAGLLLAVLLQTGAYRPRRDWPLLLARVVAASLLMGLLLWHLSGPTASWPALSGSASALRLAGLIGLGGTVYVASALLLGVRPRQLMPPREPV